MTLDAEAEARAGLGVARLGGITSHANAPHDGFLLPGLDAALDNDSSLRGMRGRARRRVDPWLALSIQIDVAMLLAALLAAKGATHLAAIPAAPAFWLSAFAVVTIVSYAVRGLYVERLALRPLDDMRSVLGATTLAAMTVLTIGTLTDERAGLPGKLVAPWLFTALAVAGGRLALDWSQGRARRRGNAARPALVVGAGRVGILAARRLLARPEVGLRPVAFLDESPLIDPREALDLPFAGNLASLERAAATYDAEHVVVAFSVASDEEVLALVRRCDDLRLSVSVVPRLYEHVAERLTVEHVGGLPLQTLRHADPRGWHFRVKYTLDRLIAALLLVVISPLLAATALAVRLWLGRPVIFKQTRVGRDGQTFDMFKFRSMRIDDSAANPAPPVEPLPGCAPGGVEGEDRRTRLGMLLRRSSIDELPQLINVLRGEMSLVGPRPERPEYVSRFENDVYRYAERHRVKSGITGWAQVHGLRGKTSVADRAEWDNFYIDNFSSWLDLKILLMTVVSVVTAARAVE